MNALTGVLNKIVPGLLECGGSAGKDQRKTQWQCQHRSMSSPGEAQSSGGGLLACCGWGGSQEDKDKPKTKKPRCECAAA